MKKIKYPVRIIDESITYLKHHSSTVLTCVGSAGVILTAVMTAKATVKAVRLINEAECQKKEELTKSEVIQITALTYLPPILIGASTIACILGANALNKQQQAMLISAYSFIDSSFKEYKDKLKELYGDETHQKIIDSIAIEKSNDNVNYAIGFFEPCILDVAENGENLLFYDEFTKRFFKATMAKVIDAEYHLNRNFSMSGQATVNEYLAFLGLDTEDRYDMIGWEVNDEYIWIDFNHRKSDSFDGFEFYVIEMQYEPSSEFLESFYW